MSRLERLGIVIGSTMLYVGVEKLFMIGCPIKYFWHIPCAGCGMTRAWKSVLQGDLQKAFYFHPLFLTVPFMGGMLIWGDLISKKLKRYFWLVMLILYMGVYCIRLMMHVAAIF